MKTTPGNLLAKDYGNADTSFSVQPWPGWAIEQCRPHYTPWAQTVSMHSSLQRENRQRRPLAEWEMRHMRGKRGKIKEQKSPKGHSGKSCYSWLVSCYLNVFIKVKNVQAGEKKWRQSFYKICQISKSDSASSAVILYWNRPTTWQHFY